MRIGELARRTGISVRMLRYYETEGLLRPPRTVSGYRDYAEADVATVRRIVLLNGAGLPLAAVGRLLPCGRPGTGGFVACAELGERIRRQLGEIDRRIGELVESRTLLAALLDRASDPAEDERAVIDSPAPRTMHRSPRAARSAGELPSR